MFYRGAGFCLVFHLRRRYMFAASLGGLLTCGVYLAAASIWSGILLPTLTAAAFAALYAEFLAWFMGAPATLFLIPALLIPLVPGRPSITPCTMPFSRTWICRRTLPPDRSLCPWDRTGRQSGVGPCRYAPPP
ncbi:MAG: threonine/serine exporter family protein [Dysosmobacter sp.]